MNLKEMTNNYIEKGYKDLYAKYKVCQDIIIYCISNSKYKNNISFKGGVVMFNLTKNIRRATVDIDIDFFELSITNRSIIKIFKSFNKKNNDIKLSLKEDKVVELSHEDYKGKRIVIELIDSYNNILSCPIDIGVHKDANIIFDELIIETNINNKIIKVKVDKKEQIIVEKLIPLLKFGVLSTRYKDLLDIYWLINNTMLNKKEILKIINIKIINNKELKYDCINEIIERLNTIKQSSLFQTNYKKLSNKWLEISLEENIDTITNYLSEFNKLK